MRLKATCALSVLCGAVYLAHPSLAYALRPVEAEPLTFATSVLMHKDMGHLLSNVAALGLFGVDYESRRGSASIVGLFAAGGILGAVAEYLADPTYAGFVIGASGAACAIIGACATTLHRMISILPLFALFAWQALGNSSGAADVAHLAGMVLGLLVAVATPKAQATYQGGEA